MWPMNSCDLISDSVGVVDTMTFKRQVGGDKNKNDASCYLRNEGRKCFI